MELLSNNTQLFSLPNMAPKACNNDSVIAEASIEEYEPLLYKIAASFGLVDSEITDLVQQVYSCFNADCADRDSAGSLKVRLSKCMVHKCIFKISSQLFSQSMGVGKLRVTDMPLSFRSVFILHHIIGFDEYEIGEMLNTNPLQVKQRFHKALLFINNHH